MDPASARDDEGEQASRSNGRGADDLSALARDLVEKVGVEGAARYCHGLGWLGVLRHVEMLRSKV